MPKSKPHLVLHPASARAEVELCDKHMLGKRNPIHIIDGRDYVTYNDFWRLLRIYDKILRGELAHEITVGGVNVGK